jgi:cation diffusion facilitator family transporter
VAILSDSLHDLGDSCSLGVAWYLERLSKKGRDRYFSYGYKRFSLLGSLLISVILLVGSVFVIKESIERIITPSTPRAEGMFLLAIFGLIINGYAAWRMSGGHSLNERAMRLHLMEDVLGWIAVLIVSVVMYFVDLPILDPLLSLGITAWILYNVYFNLRDNFRILLQGVPEEVDQEGFVQAIEHLEGVLSVHDVHIWTLNGEQHIASLHLVFDAQQYPTPEAWAGLKQQVREIALGYELQHITIELDPRGCSCGMENC